MCSRARVCFLVVAGLVIGVDARAAPPRFRIAGGAAYVYEDCSTGPRLRPGDRFALIDGTGSRGEVEVLAGTAQVYDGCFRAAVPLRKVRARRGARAAWGEVSVLIGPLEPKQHLARARVLFPRPGRGLEPAHLPFPDPRGRAPGWFRTLIIVDLDGDGVGDAELGYLICDERHLEDATRVLSIATRVRDRRGWRITDLAYGGAEWEPVDPLVFCPFEGPPAETEIFAGAAYVPVLPPPGLGLQR